MDTTLKKNTDNVLEKQTKELGIVLQKERIESSDPNPQKGKNIVDLEKGEHSNEQRENGNQAKRISARERVFNLATRMNDQVKTPRRTLPAGEIISSKIKAKYAKLESLGTGKSQILDWDDDYIRVLDHINVNIWFRANQESKIRLLKSALESLTTQVSAQSVGTIMVGAWGLRSCENIHNYVFKKHFPAMKGEAYTTDVLERRMISEVEGARSVYPELTLEEPVDKETDHWMRSATYICAAVLRLLVKEETNLKNAWSYIMTQYRNFYQEDIVINIVPNFACTTAVRQIMQSRTLIRNTAGIFLLAFNTLEGQDRGICQMLYALQMSYTGMHAYSLLLSCADRLGTPISTFVSLLEHPNTSQALETITEILLRYEFPRDPEAKERADLASTWRYARIFNQDAFAYVQTKNCMILTGVLAMVSQKLGTKGAGDVTKIRQIAGFAENQREWLEQRAQNVVEYCMGARWASNEDISGVYQDA